MLGNESPVILDNLFELSVEFVYLHSYGGDGVRVRGVLCHLVVLLGYVVQICRDDVDKTVYTVTVSLDLGLASFRPHQFTHAHFPGQLSEFLLDGAAVHVYLF